MKLQAAKKGCSIILLTLLVASILLLLLSQLASAKNNPSIPEVIAAKYVDCSYEVPPVYGTDQYTGETVVKQEGYRIDNRSLAVTLRNQPFTAYTDGDENKIGLYFNFRLKGSYGTSWDYYPFSENGFTTQVYGGFFWLNGTHSPAPELIQSHGDYTTITFTIPGAYRVPTGAVLDVQAQTMMGYMMYVDKVYEFSGETSGWSTSRTVTVGDSASSSTGTTIQNSTVSPTQASYSTTNSNANATQSGAPQIFTIGIDWQTVAITVLTIGVVLLIVVVAVQQRRLGKINSELTKNRT
jgi:hypothetical protein